MKLILLADVRNLGRIGEVIEVSDGFARNFLLPKKMAQPASIKAIANIKSRAANIEVNRPAQMDAILKRLAHAGAKDLQFTLPGDKEGHLYAGLKETEILAKITKGDASLQKYFKLPGYAPLKQAGEHDIVISAAGERKVKLKIYITIEP